MAHALCPSWCALAWLSSSLLSAGKVLWCPAMPLAATAALTDARSTLAFVVFAERLHWCALALVRAASTADVTAPGLAGEYPQACLYCAANLHTPTSEPLRPWGMWCAAGLGTGAVGLVLLGRARLACDQSLFEPA